MSFSYNEALTTDVSRVRFNTGLTQNLPGVLTDEAITGLVTLQGTWQGAVAAIYRRRAADLAQAATSTTTTDGSQTYSPAELRELADHWDRVAAAESATTQSTVPRARVGRMGDSPSDRHQNRTRPR